MKMCIPCVSVRLEDFASQRRCRQSVTLEQYSVQLHIFEPTKTPFLQYPWSLMSSQGDAISLALIQKAVGKKRLHYSYAKVVICASSESDEILIVTNVFFDVVQQSVQLRIFSRNIYLFVLAARYFPAECS